MAVVDSFDTDSSADYSSLSGPATFESGYVRPDVNNSIYLLRTVEDYEDNQSVELTFDAEQWTAGEMGVFLFLRMDADMQNGYWGQFDSDSGHNGEFTDEDHYTFQTRVFHYEMHRTVNGVNQTLFGGTISSAPMSSNTVKFSIVGNTLNFYVGNTALMANVVDGGTPITGRPGFGCYTDIYDDPDKMFMHILQARFFGAVGDTDPLTVGDNNNLSMLPLGNPMLPSLSIA